MTDTALEALTGIRTLTDMADDVERRRATKTTELMRRGGLRPSYDIPGDNLQVLLCDACREPLAAGEHVRTVSIAGIFNAQLHDVCYRVWLDFKK